MKRSILTICLCVLFVTGTAMADWEPGDGHKMHYPQLPDPCGWDVFASTIYPDYDQKVLADDWLCTESGPVEDIHLWGSWREDQIGKIMGIYVSIHDNIEEDIDPDMPWSHPGELLWERDFMDYDFTVRDYGVGDQGWFNPNTGEYILSDHTLFHQINIEHIEDPYIQEEGKTYWLDITVFTLDPMMTQWGWKTALEGWNDYPVWLNEETLLWELVDPYGDGGFVEDMAFVITPEPATIVLLGFGSLILAHRKRKE